ncbi:MAG: PAS domain S-box protein [Candidatus Thermoplasmatota archaeon]|nr:PAS domain S-box protein [Candidatus Thermoplasmatota archaeon]
MNRTQDDGKNDAVHGADGRLRQRIQQLERRVASLQRTQQQFNAVFNHPRSFVGILDLDGRLLEANRRSLEFIDAAAGDVEGRLLWETPWWSHSPELQDKLRDNIWRAARGEHVRFEADHYAPDGSRAIVDFYLQPVTDNDGEVTRLLAIGRDITERRMAEEKLDRSQWELSILNRVATIFLRKSAEDMYADVLDVVREAMDSRYGYFGYINQDGDLVCPSMTRDVWEKCEVPDRDIVFPRDSWGGLWGESLEAMETRWKNESLDLPVGHIQLSNALAVPLVDHGDLVGQFVVGNTPGGYTHEDVRLLERLAGYVAPLLRAELREKRQRQALQHSEEKYRTLTENVNLGVYRTTPGSDASFVEANPAMVDMFGYDSREELMEQPVSALYYHPGERQAFNEKMMEEGAVSGRELELRKKDGTRFVGSVSAVAVTDDGGEVQYFDGIVADITERKHMREAMAQLNDVLKLTNKIMRHDILNNLNVIEGALELYLEEQDEDMLDRAFDRIHQSVELIRRMRELEALVASGEELQSHDVRETVEEIAGQYDVPVSITGRATVLADTAFHPVIDNIVRNAVVHGGADHIDVDIDGGGGTCEICVADDGSGIPDEIKQRVFEERFSHGSSAGSGLGLYIVKKTMERYGGSVDIQDNQPTGTVVVLRLPRADAAEHQ